MSACEIELSQSACSQTPAGKRLSLKVALSYIFCAVVWGTTWYAIRLCIGPQGYPLYAAAAWRFTISSSCLAVIWLICSRQLPSLRLGIVGFIALAGALSGLGYGLLYYAEQFITGGLAAVISATTPLMVAIIAITTGTERISRAALIGSLVAIGGVALVFHDRLLVSPSQASAVAFMIGMCLVNAWSNVLMKRNGNKMSPLIESTVFFTGAALAVWLISFFADPYAIPPGPVPVVATGALLYLSIFGTLAAFASFFYLLKHVRLSTAMTLAFVTPMIAVLIDALWEKEAIFTPESWLGMIVVLIGVAVTVLKGSSTKPVVKAAPESINTLQENATASKAR